MALDRRDLSAYLVHLTRDFGDPARSNLISILTQGTIEARTPLGLAVPHLRPLKYTIDMLASQRVACFSETPLDDLHGLIDPGVWRANHFKPYGVVFRRDTLINAGANPVWYLNTFSSPGVTFRWLARDVNSLIDAVALGSDREPTPDRFAASEIGRMAPFIETMGRWYGRTKDFSFEREWRHLGDFSFNLSECVQILTPVGETESFRHELIEAGVSEGSLPLSKFRTIAAEDVIG